MYPMNQCIGMFALFFDSHLFTLSEKKEKKWRRINQQDNI